ncbi:MAG: hypothetical protein E7578_04350 [Ruminococcaceae bacterium]|nr:hypothetical protein [Oscillospiraceae bacterium]
MISKRRFLSGLMSALLLFSVAGCSDDDKAPEKAEATAGTNENITSVEKNETLVPELTEEEIEKIKDTYKLSEDEAEAFSNEGTSAPIVYSGFTSHYFSTPAKNDDIPVTAVTSILSHSGMHNYIEENSGNYSFGEGDGSFSTFAEKYNDKFFETKGLLVISFVDSKGGSDYNITGAWDTVDKVGERSLDRLVFAAKKSAGENTVGHIIIEVDSKFMTLWDAVGIELYK